MNTDKDWMALAYDLACEAASLNEVPVGAVLVDANNQLLAKAHNLMIGSNDPSAHAEILAIRNACQTLGNYRLDGCTLYVTLEPCAMCAAAMVHARIKRLVFATRDLQAGAAGSAFNLLNHPALNHRVLIDEGILQPLCATQLRDFFTERRAL